MNASVLIDEVIAGADPDDVVEASLRKRVDAYAKKHPHKFAAAVGATVGAIKGGIVGFGSGKDHKALRTVSGIAGGAAAGAAVHAGVSRAGAAFSKWREKRKKK